MPYLRCHAEKVLPNRFGELRKTIMGISQKVLTDNLRSMEQDGIIIRTVYAEVPPRVEYKLSELGDTIDGDVGAWLPGNCPECIGTKCILSLHKVNRHYARNSSHSHINNNSSTDVG
jgi:hypothetical protein